MIFAGRFQYPEEFEKKCSALVDFALTHVPLYQQWKIFDPKFLDPGRHVSVDERYNALPVLTKADMRAHFPKGLMPTTKNLEEGLAQEEVLFTFTSGTTSEKVINIWNQDWWDRSEAASWKLNRHMAELTYPRKQAVLASSLNVGIGCESDLSMKQRMLGDLLFLNEKASILQWQPRHLQRMATELNHYQPVILEANPSWLARLAYWAADTGTEIISPAVVVFTFEYPSAIHLAAIRKVFSSVFVSSYGSTETGYVMEQCENGLMHQNTSSCRIDFEPVHSRFGQDDLGRIFVTTFDNPWNYILRFDVGDLIRLSPHGECGCGRAEGMIARAVEGRAANVTFGTKGELVTTKALDDRLSTVAELREYHLEQQDKTCYQLQAMLSPGANRKTATDELICVLMDTYGKAGRYEVEILDTILPGPAGKFRRTQANFGYDESKLFR